MLTRFNCAIITQIIRTFRNSIMAKSKFEYVREFESEQICLPNTWIVIRIDGRNFSKFTDAHHFMKPNDIRALELMNRAATVVMKDFKEIILGFGQSDEYSFVFKKETQTFNRRHYKLLSNVNSLFSSAYVFHWSEFFETEPLKYPPAFDARIILYPSEKNLRDYLSWRQADVHVNNLYNTCFWNLVQKKNMTTAEAEETLRGSLSADKNELLFQDFGINYNNERPIYRKGSVLIRKNLPDETGKITHQVTAIHDDIIGDKFWQENPELLTEKMSTTQELKQKKLKSNQNKKKDVMLK